MADRLGAGLHGVEHAEVGECRVGIGDQAFAADLVAREVVLVDQHDRPPRARQLNRAGTAGRSGSDHQHVDRGRPVAAAVDLQRGVMAEPREHLGGHSGRWTGQGAIGGGHAGRGKVQGKRRAGGF
jgi:hypothetical protein